MASRGMEEAAELMLCVRDVILPLAKLADTGHCGQMSAEPMSGLNPDEMDEEGAAFAKRRQLPRRKSQMASHGMEERDRIKGYHYGKFYNEIRCKVQKIIDICK